MSSGSQDGARTSRDRVLDRLTGRRYWRPMVSWFHPRELRTALMALVSRLFGAFADRREREAWQPHDGPYRYDDSPELWLDYVADLADGWHSTATMAGLLAADALQPSGSDEALPHGRVLVMGGDQVYPAATPDNYRARLEAPYYSLHPESPIDRPRDLFVLPGNHDWYDGLSTFSRLFLQQRWFAGWLTRQSRSYFVLRLPQRWWLVAVDSQLDSDIDTAQLKYLLAATRDLAAGDRVILLSAVPFWVQEKGESRLPQNMAFLERELVQERGAKAHLTLAGDLHHYARYENRADNSQRITAGGGGAFLHGTAWLPAAVEDEDKTRWQQAKVFPSALTSRLAAWRMLLLPLFNPMFVAFFTVLTALLLWSADAASHGLLFGNAARGTAFTLYQLLVAVRDSPLYAAILTGWIFGFIGYADAPRFFPKWLRWPFRALSGSLHALLQLGIAAVAFSLVVPPVMPACGFFPALVLAALASSLAGCLLFGAWSWLLYQLLGCHHDAVWSASRVADWKNFLRIHIARDGSLTVHVLGVPRVCKRWRERESTTDDAARAAPADGVPLAQRAVLVEQVVIRP